MSTTASTTAPASTSTSSSAAAELSAPGHPPRYKVLHVTLESGTTIAVLDPDEAPPPYALSPLPPSRSAAAHPYAPQTSSYPPDDDDEPSEAQPLLPHSAAPPLGVSAALRRYIAPLSHKRAWLALLHLAILAFPLALFAWLFCFVGAVVSAALLVTLPLGLGVGWVVLVGARALARFELNTQDTFHPRPSSSSPRPPARRRPIFRRLRRVRVPSAARLGPADDPESAHPTEIHLEPEPSLFKNSVAMFTDPHSYRALVYFTLIRAPIALALLLGTAILVPISFALVVPLPALLRAAEAVGQWQAGVARDMLE